MSGNEGTQQALRWLAQPPTRGEILLALDQPYTATQLARKLGWRRHRCSRALITLTFHGYLICLNPASRASRLYGLTPLGRRCRKLLLPAGMRVPGFQSRFSVDWPLYGWVCYNHRAAVLKALTRPLQPAAIKRRACFQDSRLRMSANNVRDIIKLFLDKELVTPVREGRKRHLRYRLTDMGEQMRSLLCNADRSAPDIGSRNTFPGAAA